MKRTANREAWLDLIKESGLSTNQFAKTLGISYGHLKGILNGRFKVSHKVQKKLAEFAEGREIADLYEPEPLKGVKSITVFEKETGLLIAAVSSDATIIKDGYEVVCVPPIC